MGRFTSNANDGGDVSLSRTTRVVVGHTSTYPDALIVRAGGRLTVEPRPSKYAGWVWCWDSPGTGAWVPEEFLDIAGSVALVTSDYDSTELTVGPGEEVQVLSEVAGWAWCRLADGRRGWLPLENLSGFS